MLAVKVKYEPKGLVPALPGVPSMPLNATLVIAAAAGVFNNQLATPSGVFAEAGKSGEGVLKNIL